MLSTKAGKMEMRIKVRDRDVLVTWWHGTAYIIAVEPAKSEREIYVLDETDWLAESDVGSVTDEVVARVLLDQAPPYPGKYLFEIFFYLYVDAVEGPEDAFTHYSVSVPDDWELGYYKVALVTEDGTSTLLTLYRQRVSISALAEIGQRFHDVQKQRLLYCEACGHLWDPADPREPVICPVCDAPEGERLTRIARTADVVQYYRAVDGLADQMYQVLCLQSGLLVDHKHLPREMALEAMRAFTGADVTEHPDTGCFSAVSGVGSRDAHACPIPDFE
jgi:hypothetical protein